MTKVHGSLEYNDSSLCIFIDHSNEFRVFKNYLTERSQGRVLGSILFNIYVKDLFSLPDSVIITSFANDTAISYKERERERARETGNA